MTIPARMKHLYERLEALGIQRSYVRNVALPAGWRDVDTENPAVYSQAIGVLARNLNISLPSLQDDNARLVWQDCGTTRFKRSKARSDNELTTAKCLAVGAAQIACEAMTSPVAAVPSSGADVRAAILKKGFQSVGFDALLDYCWDSGIPVLHICNVPRSVNKPDALACAFAGRQAIVLMRRHKYPAWLLFVLAHELGHIAKGHIKDNGVLVDEKIDRKDSEDEEAEANTFAVELLTGKPDIRYEVPYNLTADQLVKEAKAISERDHVDPGFVALNYADTKRLTPGNSGGHYAVGNLALAQIEPNADPVTAICSRMLDRLDWSEVGRDSRHLLRRLSGMDAR